MEANFIRVDKYRLKYLKTAGKKDSYDLIQSVKLNLPANLSKSQRTS